MKHLNAAATARLTVTPAEAADLLGVSGSTIKRWLKDGMLPSRTIGRVTLIRMDGLRALVPGVDDVGRTSAPGDPCGLPSPPRTLAEVRDVEAVPVRRHNAKWLVRGRVPEGWGLGRVLGRPGSDEWEVLDDWVALLCGDGGRVRVSAPAGGWWRASHDALDRCIATSKIFGFEQRLEVMFNVEAAAPLDASPERRRAASGSAVTDGSASA